MDYRGQINVRFQGTAAGDSVSFYSGTGFAWGYEGNDAFYASLSDATFYGGDGNDNLSVENSKAYLDGELGDDTIYIGKASATAFAGLGNDRITMVDSSVEIHGDEGNDIILCYGGEGVIDGGAGDDYIELSGTKADIFGGAGNDVMSFGSGSGLMVGGAGDDTYIVTDAYTVCAESEGEGFDAIKTTLGSFTLQFANIEVLIGNANRGQALTATLGTVSIIGSVGMDTLTSGAGDDTLTGGGGVDLMVGGYGNDTYDVDTGGDICAEEAGAGYDIVKTSLNSYSLSLANIEVLQGNSRSAQKLSTTIRDIMIIGGAGADTLTGTGGSETLVGGFGTDVMIGGVGRDLYYVSDQGDVVAESFNSGEYDEVRTDMGSYTMSWANIERVTGMLDTGQRITATVSPIEMMGGAGNDTLVSGNGADWLNGGIGNDLMAGGNGNDIYIVDSNDDICAETATGGIDEIRTDLAVYNSVVANVERLVGMSDAGQALATDLGSQSIIGGAGNDTLNGGRGDDALVGGVGDDWLIGGAGKDKFLYLTPDGGGDRILDFQVGSDKFTITAKTFLGGYLAPGALNPAQFSVNGPSLNYGQIVYMAGSGDVYWDENGVGEDGMYWLARLDNVHNLSASDFLIV